LKKLIQRALAAGLGPKLADALKEIDYRLRVYPQFGQPLRDAKAISMQEWVGVVNSIRVRYLLSEERRLVIILTPLRALTDFGLG
jgi:hypothetical protein